MLFRYLAAGRCVRLCLFLTVCFFMIQCKCWGRIAQCDDQEQDSQLRKHRHNMLSWRSWFIFCEIGQSGTHVLQTYRIYLTKRHPGPTVYRAMPPPAQMELYLSLFKSVHVMLCGMLDQRKRHILIIIVEWCICTLQLLWLYRHSQNCSKVRWTCPYICRITPKASKSLR